MELIKLRCEYLHSFKKFLHALGQSSMYKSMTISPLLVSSNTDIKFAQL